MLTGKQKRHLRSLGMTINPIILVGKGGVSDSLIQQVDESLEAHELIKCKVQSNCLAEPKAVADELAHASGAEVAQVIGRTFLLYRRSENEPVIELP